MQTTVPNVYALGDVVPTPQLAHVASKEGIVAVEHIAGRGRMKYHCIPSCVYTVPEVASVGMTEAEARERDILHCRQVPVNGQRKGCGGGCRRRFCYLQVRTKKFSVCI